MSGIRKKSELTRSVPISVPNSSCASSTVRSGGGVGEPVHEEQPRFCVCLQHMPEPTLSQDWFDMQPTQEMNGGQVSLIDGLPKGFYFIYYLFILGTAGQFLKSKLAYMGTSKTSRSI